MIGTIQAKQDALEELARLAEELAPIARRLNRAHGDLAAVEVLTRAEGRLRILASALGAKSVEPLDQELEADPSLLDILEEADGFLASIQDNGLAGEARPVRRRLNRLAKAFGLELDRGV